MKPKKFIHHHWNWQLSGQPEDLWPYVTDTNRLFKDLHLPPVQPTDISYHTKKGHLQLSYNSIKYSEAWIEEPYEWEYPFRYGVKRTYKNGPFKEVKIQVDLLPSEKGTRLIYQSWAEPRGQFASLLSSFKQRTIIRNRLKKTFKQYDDLVSYHRLPYERNSEKRLTRGGEARLKSITDALIEHSGEEEIAKRLIGFIRKAQDIDLMHIKPYRLADHWGKNRKAVLHVFLHAVSEGLLNFNWDLYCPTCRTIRQTCKTLSEVHEPILCDTCSQEFTINFNRSIQLSFYPNPLIRKLSNQHYCLGGPATKSHIFIQQFLKSGQKRYLKTRLPRGVYHLRTLDSQGRATVMVEEHGQDTVNIRLSSPGLNGELVNICCEPNLIFENNTQNDQLFILERVSWDSTGVTAAQVTSLQTFRDLFTFEVLRRGEKIAVDKLTFMFTDLFDSTAMYHKEGDDCAVGRVIEHFEILQEAVTSQNGAIVKTIGDSIMAVFSDPAYAFRAFLNAQKALEQSSDIGNTLKLKAGIHDGKCVAVNLNNRIDYFGSTVNITSRLADMAGENEIIISECVSDNPWIHQLLADNEAHCTIQPQHTELKGFDSQTFAIKRIRLEKSLLRLVV
jgi:class 3 adenylate cyclase